MKKWRSILDRKLWRKPQTLVLAAITVLLLAAMACGGSEAAQPGAPTLSLEQEVIRIREVPVVVEREVIKEVVVAQSQATAFATGDQGLSLLEERLIVRNASLLILARDVEETVHSIGQLATDLKGFVVTSRLFGDEENRSGTVTIRVPVEETDNALQAIRDLATQVKEETLQSQDVTEEFVDLKARLRNLKATEVQMQALMDRAEKVSDVVNILRELTLIRQQIEQIQGRIEFLERTAATSKITVTVRSTTIGLEDVSPRQARQGAEDVTIAAFGFGFEEGATFYLSLGGEGEIRPQTAPRILSSDTMQATFDIPDDARVGAWNVVAELRDARSKPLANWFTIGEGEERWSVVGVLEDAALALRALATGVLWVVVFSPLWLALLLVAWFGGRRALRKSGKKTS